jgi:hypothetical protein
MPKARRTMATIPQAYVGWQIRQWRALRGSRHGCESEVVGYIVWDVLW